MGPDKMTFKAATWNVLATAYIRPEWYPGVPPERLDPSWRVPAVAQHAAALDADLLCLQEVEEEMFAALQGRLEPLGHEGRYERKGRGRPDGCATFFRRSVFALREARRLEYRDRGPGEAADSGHVALLVCLEHEGHLLGVANTHVRWDRPEVPLPDQVGWRQVTELLEACRRFTPQCDGWLVCGDFNRAPNDATIGAMRQAGFAFAHDDRPQIKSCVANGRASLIDYLFHSAALRVLPIDAPLLADTTSLPSVEQPSDHLALMAEIEWS
jgi:mRNA deadenylase 3'-5' endonuclease subunit Ccr4